MAAIDICKLCKNHKDCSECSGEAFDNCILNHNVSDNEIYFELNFNAAMTEIEGG